MTRQAALLDLWARLHRVNTQPWCCEADEPDVHDALRWLEELLDILTTEEK